MIEKDTEEIVETTQGGKQSKIDHAPMELPPLALLELANVMKLGAEKYGSNNWFGISTRSELNHGIRHFLRYRELLDIIHTDPNAYNAEAHALLKDEISHFACRALMALNQFLRTNDIGLPTKGEVV